VAYSRAVERHFNDPAGVGPLAGDDVFRGEAGSIERGAWVVIEAAIREGCVHALAFRAFGCPCLIAACSRVTELLAGRPVEALRETGAAALMADLAIPPEKLGALLVLEDALRNCFTDWDTTQPAGPR